MKIIQIVPHIGNKASGPSYTSVRLSQAIAEQNQFVFLASVKDGLLPSTERFCHKVYPKAAFPSFLWRSPQLYDALVQNAKSADILHNHSLWVMPNVYPGWVARAFSKPLIISPRGTLSEWAWNRSRLKKMCFWSVFQRAVVKQAALFHATCENEYLEIRKRGFNQPVCIVPNGIDIPEVESTKEGTGRRRLLFLGRIHPTKGVDILLHAWKIVSPRFSDWVLDIVGPDNDGCLRKMKSLASDLKLQRVKFHGALFGADKVAAYRYADLFVLPTHSENFGVTVAEALSVGTPVVVTKGAPWVGLEKHNAGWWIEIGIEPLVTCLQKALSCPPERLAEMGASGKRWVQDDFSWENIAAKMLAVYNWLLNRGPAPPYVRTD